MKVTIEWNKPTKGATKLNAFVGMVRVGSIAPSGGHGWEAFCCLPGCTIPLADARRETANDARAIVELAVTGWFDKVAPGLTLPRLPHPSGD